MFVRNMIEQKLLQVNPESANAVNRKKMKLARDIALTLKPRVKASGQSKPTPIEHTEAPPVSIKGLGRLDGLDKVIQQKRDARLQVTKKKVENAAPVMTPIEKTSKLFNDLKLPKPPQYKTRAEIRKEIQARKDGEKTKNFFLDNLDEYLQAVTIQDHSLATKFMLAVCGFKNESWSGEMIEEFQKRIIRVLAGLDTKKVTTLLADLLKQNSHLWDSEEIQEKRGSSIWPVLAFTEAIKAVF